MAGSRMEQNKESGPLLPMMDTLVGSASSVPRFSLLRRISLASLLAMLGTASFLMLLYWQDQVAEHGAIAGKESEKTAAHIAQLMSGQISSYIAATEGLDALSLRTNPGVNSFDASLDTFRELHIFKLKLYNSNGITVFSTVQDDIGGTGSDPEILKKALAGKPQHKLGFRESFRAPAGEVHNRHIISTYTPLAHAEKNIGVLEIYTDATPFFDRLYANIFNVSLIIFGAFAALYVFLYFSARKADTCLAEWHEAVADSHRKLEARDTHLLATINSALDAIISIGPDSRLIEFNPAAEAIFGWQKMDAIGQSLTELLIPERYREQHQNGLARYMQTGESHILNRRIEITALRRDGTEFPIELTVTSIRKGGSIIFTAYIRDISERQQAENELRIAAKAFESLEGMFVTDDKGVILRSNAAFTEITGYSAEEVVGKTPAVFKSGRHDAEFYGDMWKVLRCGGRWQGEIWNTRKNGEIYPARQTITAVLDQSGQITHRIVAFSDISQQKESEEQIHALAFYDPLTKLPNRRLLADRVQFALMNKARYKRQGAVLFIDIDNFRGINDNRGHDTGDLFLIEAATRLSTCIRKCDIAARTAGDEFAVLIEDLDADEIIAASETEAIGEKIRSALGKTYFLNGHECHSTVSIGATLLRGPLMTVDEMFRRADVGLYQAKACGRNTLHFFDPALQELVMARLAMENDLRHSISEQKQFLLHYQPQVDSSGRLIGAEALVRWQHHERGMVSPAQFIPLAEETGLILPLGHWVLSTACQQLVIWAARPEMAHLTVAVNVSAKQFKLPTFVDEVLALVDYNRIEPSRLKLEVTESMLLDNMDETISKMNALKAKGINFSLDDFGTGYSSLFYLKRLPLYQLKIDQSFVRDVLTNHNDAAIVKTVIALSQGMGMTVIAEGVETEGQRDFLARHGCHNYQGYFFSRPLPIDQFEVFASQMHSANGTGPM